MEQREKLSPALIAHLREVGALCVLAGCTANEIITTLRRAAIDWKPSR